MSYTADSPAPGTRVPNENLAADQTTPPPEPSPPPATPAPRDTGDSNADNGDFDIGLTPFQRADLDIKRRDLRIKTIGGVGALLGGISVIVGLFLARAELDQNRRATAERLMGEQFRSAITMLDHDSSQTRVGALTLLANVAADPDVGQRYYLAVLDMLTAHVRVLASPASGTSQTEAEASPSSAHTTPTNPPTSAGLMATQFEQRYPLSDAEIGVVARFLRERPEFRGEIEEPDLQLSGANLTGADLTNADLRKADLTGADLTTTILRKADLTGAILREANLWGAVLTGATLTNADLTKVDLIDAVLKNADLTDSDLQEAELTDAILMNANLKGALLMGADLRGAWLVGADLRGARLWGANLTRARLAHADLTNAMLTYLDSDGTFLTTELLNARCDPSTTWPRPWPDGLAKPACETAAEAQGYPPAPADTGSE